MAVNLETMFNEIQQQGLNSAKNGTLSGNLTLSGTNTYSGSGTFSGTSTFTGPIVTSGQKTVTVNASSGATVALTAAQSGQTFLFDRAGGVAYTLPPTPTAGLYFNFFVSVLQTSGANVVTAGAGVFQLGVLAMFSGEVVTPSSTLGPFMVAGNGTSHIQTTTNGTTTGGGAGSWMEYICLSSTVWAVKGIMKSPSGSIATPFST